MARVFGSARTGAQVVVFSHDHCPPHVSALQRREGWLARVRFSFVTDDVDLWDIEPIRRAPRRRDIDALTAEVAEHLADCRRVWWRVHETACLEGRLAEASDTLVLLARRRGRVRRVRTARYNVNAQSLTVTFEDGSTMTVRAGAGGEA